MKVYTILVVVLLALPSSARAQTPTSAPSSPAKTSAASAALRGYIEQAYDSGLPHRILLAGAVERIVEEQEIADPQRFGIGAASVFRHGDFTSDLLLGELYLRLLQQPVLDDLLDSLDAAALIYIDGSRRDWPRESIMAFPKAASRKQKESPVLKAFGVLRGRNSLFVFCENNKRPKNAKSKVRYTLEIAKLASRFAEKAYSISIADGKLRIFSGDGELLESAGGEPYYLKTTGRSLELKIPLKLFEEDLRSLAVRCIASTGQSGHTMTTPWVACPTGTVTAPVEMLIHFAANWDLPLHDPLGVSFALQEGLLLTSSHPDLAEQIKSDAYEWFEIAMDIAERVETAGWAPLARLPISAQLAWACRYDGSASLETVEAYAAAVPSPKTLAAMRGFSTLQSWLPATKQAPLRDRLAQFIAKEFKIFDYADDAARQQGENYVDPNAQAYYVKGEEKFLSYRDVGINQRWALFEEGFGLKGSREQAARFQRAWCLALGIPCLLARHQHNGAGSVYTISFDGARGKWYAIGAAPLISSDRSEVQFSWSKPWTRPERFAFPPGNLRLLPAGAARFLLDGDFESLSVKRFNTFLEKGLDDKRFAKSLLQPLRMR